MYEYQFGYNGLIQTQLKNGRLLSLKSDLALVRHIRTCTCASLQFWLLMSGGALKQMSGTEGKKAFADLEITF